MFLLSKPPVRTDDQRAAEFTLQIAERIRVAREEKGIIQDDFAAALGCNDRQTVSAIETGIRKVSPQEMVKIAKILGRPLSYFTDPYIVAETNAFSYRARLDSAPAVNSFEKRAHKLISANRRFRNLLGEPDVPFGNQLKGVNKLTPLMAAVAAGERTAKSLGLGETPALRLRESVEEQLRVFVLFIDAPESISGAACHLQDGDYVLINRKEPSFRRNFNLGHELFHILTWTEMPPARVDAIMPTEKRPKVEKLADNFSSGLLMPSEPLRLRWSNRPPQSEIHEWLVATARDFRVSGEALYWRLVNMNLLTKPESVDLRQLSRWDEDDKSGKPNLYNSEFVRRLHAVLDRGLVGVVKAAELLECEPYDLKRLVSSYGLDPTF